MMKRHVIFACLTGIALGSVLVLSSCVPRPPGRRGVVILPGHPRGPAGVPRPRVVRPPRPYAGAVWVDPVYHWNGKTWIVKKNGYWVKPKNVPRGKAKGHKKRR